MQTRREKEAEFTSEALAWGACAYNTLMYQLLSGCLFQIKFSIMTFYSYMSYYLLSYVCGCLVGFFSQEFGKTLGNLLFYTEEAEVFSSSLWVSFLKTKSHGLHFEILRNT